MVCFIEPIKKRNSSIVTDRKILYCKSEKEKKYERVIISAVIGF
jgi:hypothetical protein